VRKSLPLLLIIIIYARFLTRQTDDFYARIPKQRLPPRKSGNIFHYKSLLQTILLLASGVSVSYFIDEVLIIS